MFRKIGLQEQINSDEDYNKLLQQDGLLEFFGPCTGMIGILNKLKEMDKYRNVRFAACKSDNISILQKFRNSCKPTWLFVVNGKAVRMLIGADAPKLERYINEELCKIEKFTENLQEKQNQIKSGVNNERNLGQLDDFEDDTTNEISDGIEEEADSDYQSFNTNTDEFV